MPTPSVPLTGGLADEVAQHRIGVGGVVANQLSQIAPATVMFGVVPTAVAATGLIGVPIAMIAVALTLYLFLAGYLAMARHIPNPGAFYAYIAQGLWKPLGVAAAWLALAAYVSFANASYAGFGFTFSTLLGGGIPWWVCSLAAVVVVGALAIRPARVAGRVLAVLVVAETLAVIVTTFGAIAAPGFEFSAAAMDPSQMWGSAGGRLFVIGVTGFVGYEAAAVYIRDSRDPRRTVPRASYITLGGIAVLYWFASWVQISAAGSAVFDRAGAEGPTMFANSAAATLGSWAVTMNDILFCTSLFAAAFAFQLVGPRYLAVTGQERVMPAFFGRTVNEAPRNASLALSAFAVVVVLGYALGGLDPLVNGFFWLGTAGAIGVLLLSAVTSPAVIGFFARNHRGESLWHRLVAPAIATLVLSTAAYLALTNLDTLYGPGSETITAATPWILVAILVLGVAWGLVLRAQRPQVYASIGLGLQSTTNAFDELFAPGTTTTGITPERAAR